MTYYCADCNYCLRGLPENRPCPECGGASRRASVRDARRIARLIIVGSVAAIVWGVAGTWGLFKAANVLLSGPALTGVTTRQFSGPKSGRYESIVIQSRTTRETRAVLLPEVITGSFELTITRIGAADGTPTTTTHKGLMPPTLDEAILILTGGTDIDDPDLRREAMVVVQTIRNGFVPPYSGNSPPEDRAVAVSGPPTEFIREATAFSFAKGFVLMSQADRPVPLIARVAGLGVLGAGWFMIAMFLRRALRRAGMGIRLES